MRRVVVTGIGLLTALGTGVDQTWSRILAGTAAVGPIEAYDPTSLRTRIGAEISTFDPAAYAPRRSLRMMTRNDQLGLAGAALAFADAGLKAFNGSDDGDVSEGRSGARVGLFVGANKEVSKLDAALDAVLTARDGNGRADFARLGLTASSVLAPLFYVEGLQGASLFYISQAFGLLGPNSYFAGTADASAKAIGRAMRCIRRGEADIVLAGGFDDAVSWWSMAKMDGLGVMTDRNDLGTAACRPYDRDRTGSVLGEGAAFLVLEERASAVARGARIYAELSGVGAAMDNYATLTPSADGRGVAGAIAATLRDAARPASEVSYVVMDGAATAAGDVSECRGIRRGLAAAADRVVASAVTAQTGHLMAGAGALNAAVAALAVHTHVAPRTVNLDSRDPECAVDLVTDEPRETDLGALALSMGLEGQATALLFTPDG